MSEKRIYYGLTLWVLLMCLGLSVMAKGKIKRPDSYEFRRGLEAIKECQYSEAISFFTKELKDNEKNAYAYVWSAIAYKEMGKCAEALTAAGKGIQLMPKKDNNFVCLAYMTRADVYAEMGEVEKALADYRRAISADASMEDPFRQRAKIYQEMEKYELSNADYMNLVALNEGDFMNYLEMGHNYNELELWDKAFEQLSMAIKLEPEYALGYCERAKSLARMNRWQEACDDLIYSLSLDKNDMAFNLMTGIPEKGFSVMETKLKVQHERWPQQAYWLYVLGALYENHGKYEQAIESYREALRLGEKSIYAERLSVCLSKVGYFKQALKYVNAAMDLDPADYDLVMEKASYLYNIGETMDAVDLATRYLEYDPESDYIYYMRGFYRNAAGLIDEAIDDYSMAINLDPEWIAAYLGRADCYLKRGEMDKANADYRYILDVDTIPGENSCGQFAYWGLGEHEKAISFNDQCVKACENNADVYYDAACLYARMGKTSESVGWLRKAFEKGYVGFGHMAQDDDLDCIRNLPEYTALLEKYQLHEIELTEMADSCEVIQADETIEIPLVKKGGVYDIECSLNGLTLTFCLDTGAADISLSSVEADFMLKNGYLSQKDMVGTKTFRDAQGNLCESTTYNVRELDLGGMLIKDVQISVVPNHHAPLLLGQTVLSRFGKYEIDNRNKVIRIIP